MEEIVFLYAIFLFFVACAFVATIASSRSRSGFGWFLLSLLVTPILTFALVVSLPSAARAEHDAPVPEPGRKLEDPKPAPVVSASWTGRD